MVLLYNFLIVAVGLSCFFEGSLHAARKKKQKKIVVEEKVEKIPEEKVNKQQFVVKVLLDERDDLGVEPITLRSPKGFVVSDPKKDHKKMTQESEIVVTSRKGSILLNNKKVSDQVLLTPLDETISFNEGRFRGAMMIARDNGNYKLVNYVPMEEYVASVLMTESWPGWSLEVNKAFAIASRTYVIAMVKASKNNKTIYHVRNTNKHQTYSGDHDCQIFKDAVEQTKGLFIAYKNKPITAMFDACCGGLIPAHMHGVNFKDAPYLARKKVCDFCKDAKVFAWEVDYHVDALAEIMQREIPSLKRVKDCRVTKKDRAGIVKEVTIKGHDHVSVTGKKVYSLVKGVKSFCFNVHKTGSRIVFKGRGMGHHLGLCQWGAKEMVEQGYTYKDVLEFYYPGTNLMRIV